MDLDAIRPRFPALAVAGPGGIPPVHADAPGGTQIVDDALNAMVAHLRAGTSNHGGAFPTSAGVDALVDRARTMVGPFLGTEADGVVFGLNMTTLTFHVARALAQRLGPDDELVCTRLDHDANVAPWLAVADRVGARVRWVELDPATGTLDLATLEAAVGERTRLVAFPRASNALGTLVDPAPFVAAAREVGALTYLDAVHAAPHVALDRRAAGIDFLVCSAYKFFGPHAGVLAAEPGVLANLDPDKVRPAPDTGPDRWQTGTASFEAIAGIAGAVAYLGEIGMDAIRKHETELGQHFLDGLADVAGARVHGPAEAAGRTPTFAITLAGETPAAVAARLAAAGVYVWHGHYYAIEPMRALGLLDRGGAVRVGFAHYHGHDDVDRVLAALRAR